MAVGDRLPVLTPVSATSNSSSSSSSPPVTRRRSCVQVATDNSSTFIQFPTNSRQSSVFVPTYRPRTCLSTTRPLSNITDTKSISNNSKSSTTPPPSIGSADQERNQSQQRCNPILNNALLNHRKEQPKSFPVKTSIDFSSTTRICLSSKPSRTVSNDDQISTNRVNTVPLLAHQTESSTSDKEIISNDNENNEQQESYCLDKSKYDYITRWLYEVEQASFSKKTFSKTRRPKNRFLQT